MKIEKSYPKLSNLFLFVSDLSQWNNLTCLPKRKKEWIKKTGNLNQQEKDKLKKFSDILQQTENNLELVFLFGKNDAEDILKKKNNQKKIKEISDILVFFKEKFDLIWENEEKKLKSISRQINLKNIIIKENLKKIQKLCGLSNKQLPEKVALKLFISAPEEYQAWSFKNIIILECSGYNKKINDIYNIFLHECFHILLKKNKNLFNKFSSIIKSNQNIAGKNKEFKIWGAEIIFEEALISSFLPEGYLGQKIGLDGQKDNKKDSLERLRNFCQSAMFNMARDYAEKSRKLDEKYFLEIAKNIEKFIRGNKEE